jgi:GntR family transcriptional regulator, transcriptional repressor for pyruvate dehydrogenase complex
VGRNRSTQRAALLGLAIVGGPRCLPVLTAASELVQSLYHFGPFGTFGNVDKDSLANRLVREILARIFSGEYAVGARLPPERALSEDFRISRGTVRQALGILAELRAIAVRHGSGAYVQSLSQFGIPADYLPPEISNVSLDDILRVRKAIEPVAAELACEGISALELKRLDGLVARMEASAEDLPTFLKHDLAFHEAIVRFSGNSPLIAAFEAVRQYLRYFQVFSSRGADDEQRAMKHHRRILLALRRRDAKAAARAVRRHLGTMGPVPVNPARRRRPAGAK